MAESKPPNHPRRGKGPTSRRKMDNTRGITASTLLPILLLSQLPQSAAKVYPSNHKLYKFDYLGSLGGPKAGIKPRLTKRDNPIPLIVTNKCPDVIWPGVATQAGDAPDVHGFELAAGDTMRLTVGPTWAGRVWGRTNCTLGGEGSGVATCSTGDCMGKLDCQYGGSPPQTLAEFNLAGGDAGDQTFYDISLVDGYNLPLGIVYHPADNLTYIPPNLVNPACIGTSGYLSAPSRTGVPYGTNSTYPIPFESFLTNSDISNWCPWDLQSFPPFRPGDGIYPYPDDNIQRPVFDPCLSACASTHAPADCCTGSHHDSAKTCHPSLYSQYAKTVCPDAYSFAYDDASSTFAVPLGGGWEVVFCPEGRSTNILATFRDQLAAGGIPAPSSGATTDEGILADAMNVSYIETHGNSAPRAAGPKGTIGVWSGLVLWIIGFSVLFGI